MKIWLIFGIKKNIFIRYFKLYLLIYCFCIMYHECHIWFLRHFEDFFEIAISCICQINIIFLSFYINSLLYFMLFRYHLVVFSYLVFNMHKHSIFFSSENSNLQRVLLHLMVFLVIIFHIELLWSNICLCVEVLLRFS